MPAITPRICGICPVSHHLASAKAGDALLGSEIPPAAMKLRELMQMARYVRYHALHFFHLASPDPLFGTDVEPAKRNLFGLIGEKPEIAVKGVTWRNFGQEIIEALGGNKVHPNGAIPGGENTALSPERRERSYRQLGGVVAGMRFALDLLKDYYSQHGGEAAGSASLPSCYQGLVGDGGNLELYDGNLRLRDSRGFILEDKERWIARGDVSGPVSAGVAKGEGGF
jgi:NAD-reducing hydrogenase large subunit